ncbi:SAM-dependent methyltransferase [Kitasatospora sp. MAA4]|uniref:methyltransferase domain-containing protein n=1 Tax=Kitasatospora sp. MAA4 TaxID=3035093 RepID=UPI0024767312|nr:methyltransferase domain-containing protein [Kitasatospora sp. MAA4]MDH6132923.1 SAM-dependent methyltransferase [Kitasatospora sp. MAA4]
MTTQLTTAPGRMDDQRGEPRIADVFGELVTRCWADGGRPGSVFEVLERIDGAISVNDTAHWFADPSQWHGPERWACEQAAGRILDIGSGPGRHATVLAAAGHDVLCLDSSPGAVAVARQRGLEVVHGELGGSEALGTFDTLLLLGNNLGFLQSREAAPGVLAQLAQLAHPGTQILATTRDLQHTRIPEHIAYRERNRRAGRLPGQNHVRIRHLATATPWFDYLFASVDEVAELVRDSPWTLADSRQEGTAVAVRLVLGG